MKTKLKIHSIKYNFLMNAVLTISSFIFPLITFPYVSRILGPAPNGKISFATAIISYFSLLASMGIPTYGVRKIAEVRDNQEKLNKALTELIIINSLFTVLSYLILLILVIFIPRFRQDALLIGITSIQIIFNTFGVDWFYQGIEQYDYITVRNLAFKVIGIILMFIFVHNPSDYIIYAGITVIGNVGSNFLNIIKLRDYAQFKITNNLNLKQHLKPIFTLFLYSAITVIYTNLDQVMLGFMSTNKEVGFYSATVKIENILTSLITSLGAVTLPRITYYINHNEKEKFEPLITKSFDFVLLLSIPLTIYFILEAKPIIYIVAGKGYTRAGVILQYIIPAIIFVGLNSVASWQILLPFKMEKWVLISSTIGALIDVIVNIIAIPSFGGIGTALSTTLAESSSFFTQYIVLRKQINQMVDLKDIAKILFSNMIALIILGLLTLVHCPFLVYNSGMSLKLSFINCICVAFIYFGICFAMLLILKENIVFENVGGIVNRFWKK